MSSEDPWKFLVDNEDRIRGILRRLDASLEDEMWTNVVLERIQRIVLLYDVSYGTATLRTYVLNNLRLYAMKYVALHYRKEIKLKVDDNIELAGAYNPDAAIKQLVNVVLESLSKTHSTILLMRYYFDYNFHEIGDAIGRKRGMAQIHHNEALIAAREELEKRGLTIEDVLGKR